MTTVESRPDQEPPAQKNDTSLPEQPTLAPNVELSGQMQEGGFEQEQWLVQRDGQFVQVTELLYRVAESSDGEHTVEEIAHAVSDKTGRGVSADNVRTLLQKKLIPLGLVANADGTVVERRPAGGSGGSRSPLQISMRTKVLSPRFINPVTAVLMQLYRPPILLAILVATVLGQGWVFFVHGIAQSIHQTLYHPGLMLAVLGFVIASAAFHEFGHASALRYGGGTVRGMGVGMYLVYPAVYTDVTDNYRLSRWNRVRTDLGGFYFNLIFALATIGIYFLTRQEWLLIVVMLTDIEIIHQSLPFVRLDGYWALADITGLPDFFSQIVPFLRTVLPIPGWKGRTLPDLKGWVKAVFTAYIVVTIPLLAFLFLLMIKSVPRLLATSWDSMGNQVHTLHHAQAAGDIVGIVFAALQLVLLALPTFGIFLILYKVGRSLVTFLWRWSKPTPARRVMGGAISAGIVALLVYFFAPQLPFAQKSSGPLAQQMHFTPVTSHERGTVGDAVASVPVLNRIIPPQRVSRPVSRSNGPLTAPHRSSVPAKSHSQQHRKHKAASNHTTPTAVSGTPTPVASMNNSTSVATPSLSNGTGAEGSTQSSPGSQGTQSTTGAPAGVAGTTVPTPAVSGAGSQTSPPPAAQTTPGTGPSGSTLNTGNTGAGSTGTSTTGAQSVTGTGGSATSAGTATPPPPPNSGAPPASGSTTGNAGATSSTGGSAANGQGISGSASVGSPLGRTGGVTGETTVTTPTVPNTGATGSTTP